MALSCVRHPNRAGSSYCQKTNRWFCRHCGAACLSPNTYCKFRTACLIWAREHDRAGDLVAAQVPIPEETTGSSENGA